MALIIKQLCVPYLSSLLHSACRPPNGSISLSASSPLPSGSPESPHSLARCPLSVVPPPPLSELNCNGRARTPNRHGHPPQRRADSLRPSPPAGCCLRHDDGGPREHTVADERHIQGAQDDQAGTRHTDAASGARQHLVLALSRCPLLCCCPLARLSPVSVDPTGAHPEEAGYVHR